MSGSGSEVSGLGEYEATFRENNANETVLPNLTAEDIKALGIATVGHRRELLDAIALLHAGADAPPSSTSLPTAPVAAAATAEAAGERRHS